MNSLKTLCEKCESGFVAKGQACPFRSLSNDYCEEYENLKKELDILDYYRQKVGEFKKGTTKLWWENIRIIVDDKTKEIWQTSEEISEDKTITLNECLEIAKKELDYECGVMIIICESYLSGIIYRYGNYPNCNDFEIAGKMHGFA